MTIARNIAKILNKTPKLKQYARYVYQIGAQIFRDSSSSDNLVCVSACDGNDYEHLFGYYDKSPWNVDCDKMVFLRVKNAHRDYASSSPAQIILLDCKNNKSRVIAESRCWNSQQGCMLQWIGEKNERIVFNSFDGKKYISVVQNIYTNNSYIINMPIYSVAKSGKVALTLDFSRLNTFRPGYGYMNLTDSTKGILCPNSPCIWSIDMIRNTSVALFSYADLANIAHKSTMDKAYHKVNHIMISPSGEKFIFLHRWILNGVKYDRMLICDIDGKNLKILLDDGMVSHSNWNTDSKIISFARTSDKGDNYYLIDLSINEIVCLSELFPNVDGHPSFSPNGRYVITDTYPDFHRQQKLYLIDMKKKTCNELAHVYAPLKYANEMRCDLHPRWKPNGKSICFDGTFSGIRQVYECPIN